MKPARPSSRPRHRAPTALRWFDRLNARFWRALARAASESGPAGGAGARVARAARILVLAALSFNVNEVPVRAAALVFTTLLAFIPFAIILSSAAGWLGYIELFGEMIPYLMSSLNLDLPIDPLLAALDRAGSISFRQLGLFGSLGLLVGFYLSMSSVEEAMNRVWNVRGSRGPGASFARYTPFLLLLSALVIALVYLLVHARELMETLGFGRLPEVLSHFSLPGSAWLFGSLGVLILMWILMFLMTLLLPKARVRTSTAMLGATAGIVPLYALTRVLLLFPAIFVERNQMFYGSLAVVPVALLIVYVFWICVLFGCAVAFVHERLRHDAGHAFFARGHGLVADWQAAMRETRELYKR